MSCAMALAVFDISKTVKDGKIIEPEVKYTTGTIRFVVRSIRSRKSRTYSANRCGHAAIRNVSNAPSDLGLKKRLDWFHQRCNEDGYTINLSGKQEDIARRRRQG